MSKREPEQKPSKSLDVEKKAKTRTGVAFFGSHAGNAARFLGMCEAFDKIKSTYVRVVPYKQPQSNYPQRKEGEEYLFTHLKHWVGTFSDVESAQTRCGNSHQLIKRRDGDDFRRTIPATIVSAIQQLDDEELWGMKHDDARNVKVPVTWIVCYLNNIKPEGEGFENFDCSHRCITSECITAACLCWESKSANQARGNNFCSRKCAHDGCDKTICLCQSIHEPHCL